MATRMFCDGCGREISLPVRAVGRDLEISVAASLDVGLMGYAVVTVGRAKLDLCAAEAADGSEACLDRVLDAMRSVLPCMPKGWGARPTR